MHWRTACHILHDSHAWHTLLSNVFKEISCILITSGRVGLLYTDPLYNNYKIHIAKESLTHFSRDEVGGIYGREAGTPMPVRGVHQARKCHTVC